MIPRECRASSALISWIIYLLISLTFQSQSSFAQQNKKEGTVADDLFSLIKTEFEKQNDRIALLELQNRNQDGEIGFLKTDNLQIHNQIDLINGKKLNQDSPNSNIEPLHNYDGNTNSDSPLINPKDHEKRAARLLPLSLLL